MKSKISLSEATAAEVILMPAFDPSGGSWKPGLVCAYDDRYARFAFDGSRDCVVDNGEIVFGDGRASFLQSSDTIFGIIKKTADGYVVTAWTHTKDYSNARKLAAQNGPKPAAAVQRNQTGRDRRQRYRTIIPFEQQPLATAVEADASKVS